MNETPQQRLDREWEADPAVKAARLLAEHDRTCNCCRTLTK